MTKLTEERIRALVCESYGKKDPAAWLTTSIEAECRVPDGWQLVPMEPTASQLDVAVSFALNVKLCNDYNWSAYMRDVYARMISAAPKPDPERKHEIVPTLAEPSEYAKAFQDMITHGCSFMKDGMRIPPEDVIEPAEPDCECGAVASEHCPACEPVAQEYQPLGPATTEDQKIYDSIAANYSQPVAQEPVKITDGMAYAFHNAIGDGSLGESEVEEIKTGLRAAFANIQPQPDQSAELATANAVIESERTIYRGRIAELEVTIEAQRTLYANCIKISHEADELEHKCNRLERQQAVLVEALEKLARLGNGEHYGNSEGNCIAIAALASVKGNAEVTGVTTGENDAT